MTVFRFLLHRSTSVGPSSGMRTVGHLDTFDIQSAVFASALR
jgi:hypothetical protein